MCCGSESDAKNYKSKHCLYHSFLSVQIPCILLGVNEPWCRKGEVLWCRTNAPKCVPPFHELLLKSVLEAEIKWEITKKCSAEGFRMKVGMGLRLSGAKEAVCLYPHTQALLWKDSPKKRLHRPGGSYSVATPLCGLGWILTFLHSKHWKSCGGGFV